MSIEEHINKLECFRNKLEANEPFRLAVVDVNASRAERIFTDGKNTSGSQIGSYSTTPAYFNPQDFPKKFTPAGKPGSKVNKQNRKTKYFEGGYAKLRESIGRESGFVDLTMFGNLKSNLENPGRAITKVSNDEYHVGLDEENAKKKEGLEKRFGEIFNHTEDEKDHFYDTCAVELERELARC